jgi:hypothetical protein
MVPSRALTRLWQLTERALADPHLPLRIASGWQFQLGLDCILDGIATRLGI